ncbi:MAG: 30S ribosomal protein S12 methylthiotransferase RimO [Gemmatimonadaceae bacterium]
MHAILSRAFRFVKVGFITLGCDKNTVDTERYLAQLVGCGAEPVVDLIEADVIVVNTCGFVDAAKRESIDAIVEAGRLKAEGSCRAIVAVGCMVERHRSELEDALPEVDLFLGSSQVDRLIPELGARGLITDAPTLHPGERYYSGDLPHVRYLKVSEGCDHGCAFCAIPLMRGRHRSFALPEVVAEAQLLEAQGAREVNLVAQDLAHYGRDRRDGVELPELLEALVAETNIAWLRMLYLYSTGITSRLLEVVAKEPRILRYIDMPIQHASDVVLARMRRPERQGTIRERVARYRDAVPDVAIRTTCIVGYPGETGEDVERLADFLEEMQFERVGVFAYSPQEGTRAFALADDVPDDVKRDRVERVTELQRAITAERYERYVGRVAQAIVDRPASGPEWAPARHAQARFPWQADDIDGVTHLALPSEAPPGSLVEARVENVVDDYDFSATALRVLSAPPAPKLSRRLPLVSATIGSFGR